MTAGVHSRGRLRVQNEEAIMKDYVQLARTLGFTDAALMDTAELVIVPEYRQFCEENLCGNYNVLPVCPLMPVPSS